MYVFFFYYFSFLCVFFFLHFFLLSPQVQQFARFCSLCRSPYLITNLLRAGQDGRSASERPHLRQVKDAPSSVGPVFLVDAPVAVLLVVESLFFRNDIHLAYALGYFPRAQMISCFSFCCHPFSFFIFNFIFVLVVCCMNCRLLPGLFYSFLFFFRFRKLPKKTKKKGFSST